MSREMKNSEIPWIGEIPSHWETFAIKHIMRNKSVRGFPNEQVLSLYREYGVIPKDSRDDNFNVTSEDTSSYKLVDVGDFVINKMKAWQGSMAVSEYRGIISPAYYICTFTAPVNKRYIHYLLRSDTYKAEYMRLSTGLRVGQWDLNVEDFLHIPMVLPSQPEQQAIADFLDKKCSEIDEMVTLQEHIIEGLKEYKQSIITESVTKGLNHDVAMKDSGSVWIGTIPNHWTVSRVGLHYTITLGKMLCDKPFDGGTLEPYYCAANVHFDGIDNKELKRMWFNEEERNKYRVQMGDLLVVEGGAGAGGCSIVSHLHTDTFIQNSIMIVRSHNHDCRFLKYLLERLVTQGYVDFVCNKATIPHFTKEKLSQVPYAFPSATEQKSIADYLDEKCAKIDTLVSVRQAKIEALKEYKKSIIYEYVTGKKEVL